MQQSSLPVGAVCMHGACIKKQIERGGAGVCVCVCVREGALYV